MELRIGSSGKTTSANSDYYTKKETVVIVDGK